jgi:Rrf2 family nitric oxide-sensitive transcriptional repressor
MQLTKFSDYALRVLMYVAQREDRHATIAEIATAHALSQNHLMKVVHRLASRGYLATSRGRGGGIRLARAAGEISIGAVVRDMEPVAVVECLAPDYDRACRLFPRCLLMRVMRDAQEGFLRALDRHTLAEISGTPVLQIRRVVAQKKRHSKP